MSNKERRELLKILEKYKAKNLTKTQSRKLLVDAGIFTKSGKLKKEYKNLCIPQEAVTY